jgi:hypothetical protein
VRQGRHGFATTNTESGRCSLLHSYNPKKYIASSQVLICSLFETQHINAEICMQIKGQKSIMFYLLSLLCRAVSHLGRSGQINNSRLRGNAAAEGGQLGPRGSERRRASPSTWSSIVGGRGCKVNNKFNPFRANAQFRMYRESDLRTRRRLVISSAIYLACSITLNAFMKRFFQRVNRRLTDFISE